MKNKFKAYFIDKNNENIKDMLNEYFFVFDTNVLLHLYTVPEKKCRKIF